MINNPLNTEAAHTGIKEERDRKLVAAHAFISVTPVLQIIAPKALLEDMNVWMNIDYDTRIMDHHYICNVLPTLHDVAHKFVYGFGDKYRFMRHILDISDAADVKELLGIYKLANYQNSPYSDAIIDALVAYFQKTISKNVLIATIEQYLILMNPGWLSRLFLKCKDDAKRPETVQMLQQPTMNKEITTGSLITEIPMNMVEGAYFNLDSAFGYEEVMNGIYKANCILTDDMLIAIRNVFFFNREDGCMYGLVINPRSVVKVNMRRREARYNKHVSALDIFIDRYADEFSAIVDREGEAIIIDNGERLINIRKKSTIDTEQQRVDLFNVMEGFHGDLLAGSIENIVPDTKYTPDELYNAFVKYANVHSVVPITKGTFNNAIQRYVLDISTKSRNPLENWAQMRYGILVRSSFIPSNNICYYVYKQKIPTGSKIYYKTNK